jgi:hypothetical protein
MSSIEKITVDRIKLLGIIKINLEKYEAIYTSSIDAYWKLAERKISKMLERVKQQRQINTYLDLNFPIDHREDYKLIINILEMLEDEKIQVTPQEFSKYVLNNWTWREDFIMQTTSYVSGISGCSGSSGRTFHIDDEEFDNRRMAVLCVIDDELIDLMDKLEKF